MDNSKPLTREHSSVGDTAVDGLLHGVAAGLIMAIYLVLIGLATSTGLAATLSAFDLGGGVSPVRGALIHLAVAGIYGIVFSLIYRLIARRRLIGRSGNVLIGLGYGLLLWSITQIAFATGIDIALSSLPAIQLVIAHAVYGVTLGWLTGRSG